MEVESPLQFYIAPMTGGILASELLVENEAVDADASRAQWMVQPPEVDGEVAAVIENLSP